MIHRLFQWKIRLGGHNAQILHLKAVVYNKNKSVSNSRANKYLQVLYCIERPKEVLGGRGNEKKGGRGGGDVPEYMLT